MRTGRKIWCSILLFSLLGCSTSRVVNSNEDYVKHARFEERVVADSVFLHDSIYVREKADTVFFTKYRTLYKERLVHDTVAVCDTLYVERLVTKEVKQNMGSRKWLLLLLLPATLVMWRVCRGVRRVCE